MKNKKNIVETHFDKIGSEDINISIHGSASNPKLLQFPYVYIEEIINDYISKSSIEINVLDYCCGTGLYSIYPSLRGMKVDGIDISDKSINVAKLRSKKFGVSENCYFQKMDAEILKFKDNKFDLILSYNSLTYLNLEKSFKELSRVINKDGKLLIMDSVGHNILFLFNRSKNLNNWAGSIKNDIRLLKKKDIDLTNKYFHLDSIKYFGFFSLVFLFLERKIGLKVKISLIDKIDQFLLSLPFAYLLAFKYVAVYSPKKS